MTTDGLVRRFASSGTFDRILPVIAAQLFSICVHIALLLAKRLADALPTTRRAELLRLVGCEPPPTRSGGGHSAILSVGGTH